MNHSSDFDFDKDVREEFHKLYEDLFKFCEKHEIPIFVFGIMATRASGEQQIVKETEDGYEMTESRAFSTVEGALAFKDKNCAPIIALHNYIARIKEGKEPLVISNTECMKVERTRSRTSESLENMAPTDQEATIPGLIDFLNNKLFNGKKD